eukprot:GHVT01016530.1.p1 GENE.GHVT01016530.1~~GHVT01016530.1.p1  ORF type:complete len:453 (-),score=118.72 GHVT01016530.1:1134-2492(-)
MTLNSSQEAVPSRAPAGAAGGSSLAPASNGASAAWRKRQRNSVPGDSCSQGDGAKVNKKSKVAPRVPPASRRSASRLSRRAGAAVAAAPPVVAPLPSAELEGAPGGALAEAQRRCAPQGVQPPGEANCGGARRRSKVPDASSWPTTVCTRVPADRSCTRQPTPRGATALPERHRGCSFSSPLLSRAVPLTNSAAASSASSSGIAAADERRPRRRCTVTAVSDTVTHQPCAAKATAPLRGGGAAKAGRLSLLPVPRCQDVPRRPAVAAVPRPARRRATTHAALPPMAQGRPLRRPNTAVFRDSAWAGARGAPLGAAAAVPGRTLPHDECDLVRIPGGSAGSPLPPETQLHEPVPVVWPLPSGTAWASAAVANAAEPHGVEIVHEPVASVCVRPGLSATPPSPSLLDGVEYAGSCPGFEEGAKPELKPARVTLGAKLLATPSRSRALADRPPPP